MSNICSFCFCSCEIITVTENLNIDGKQVVVNDLEFYHCETCNEDFADAKLDRVNSIRIKKEKEKR